MSRAYSKTAHWTGPFYANVDVRGYFQYHTSYYLPFKDEIRSVCRPAGTVQEIVESGWTRVAERGRTVVALHLRRSDYGRGIFFVAPSGWYRTWLDEIWPTLDDPVLYIASESPERVLGDFSEYDPVSARDIGANVPGYSFYFDFYALSRSNHLAISNSSFSFAASMLNEDAETFMRPVLPEARLLAYDPWDSEPLLRDRVEDHPDVPGITG